MPLKKSASKKALKENITELKKDNNKSGKAKGANGKVRPMKQIIAIALNTAGVSKKMPMKSKEMSKMDKKMDKGKEKKVEKKEYSKRKK